MTPLQQHAHRHNMLLGSVRRAQLTMVDVLRHPGSSAEAREWATVAEDALRLLERELRAARVDDDLENT